MVDRNQNLTFSKLVKKFEKQFDLQELEETSCLLFESASQYPDEKLMDWADRVLILAQKAYISLPGDFYKTRLYTGFALDVMTRKQAKALHVIDPNPWKRLLTILNGRHNMTQVG